MVIVCIEIVKFKMFLYSKNMDDTYLKSFYFTSWTQDVPGTYRRRSGVFSICFFTCVVKVYKYDYSLTCGLLLMKEILRQCGYRTKYFYVLGRKHMTWRTFVWYWCLPKVSFLHYLLSKLLTCPAILSKNTRRRTKKF